MTGWRSKLATNHDDLITYESRKKAQIGSQKRDRTNSFGKTIWGPGTPVNNLVLLMNRCSLNNRKTRKVG